MTGYTHNRLNITLTLSAMLIVALSCNNSGAIDKETDMSSNLGGYKTAFCFYDGFNFVMDKTQLPAARYLIENGAYTVFIYEHHADCTIDAEYDVRYYEQLAFKIDTSADAFFYKDSSLIEIQCTYSWFAATKIPQSKIIRIEKGSISGKKDDNNAWNVFVDIDTGFEFGGLFSSDESGELKIHQRVTKCDPVLANEI